MKKIIIILILLFTSSCRWFADSKFTDHNLAFTNIRVPPGTPNFQKGYKDGCSTVLYSRGYGLYRTRYDYKFDPELIDDPEYFFGRKRGYNYCFGYITGGSGHFSGGWDRYLFAQGSTGFNMGKGNLNNTALGGGVLSDKISGGVGGFLGVLQQNRAGNKKGSVMGGHIFYGNPGANSGNILGF